MKHACRNLVDVTVVSRQSALESRQHAPRPVVVASSNGVTVRVSARRRPRARQVPMEVVAVVGIAAADVAAAAGNPVRYARRRREATARRFAADLDPTAGDHLAHDPVVSRDRPILRQIVSANIRPAAEHPATVLEAASAKGANCKFIYGVSQNR